ncbi:MAG: lipid-binding SYLF domain-containing protein, partial [Candidatus Levyibacteriota bacterium]
MGTMAPRRRDAQNPQAHGFAPRRSSKENFMSRQWLRLGGIAVAAAALWLSFLPVAQAQSDQQKLVNQAEATLNNFLRDPEMKWLQQNLHRAKAVLIAPEVVKAGFIFGGSGGRAVLLARDAKTGRWRGPVFYTMATASVGFQAGIAASENVTMVMTEKGVNTLLAT